MSFGRVPYLKLSIVLSPWSPRQHCLPLAVMCDTIKGTHQGVLAGSSEFRVFIGVSWCRHDWLTHWQSDWTQSPTLSLPWRLGWCHRARSPCPLITGFVLLSGQPEAESSHQHYLGATWSHLTGLNCQVWSEQPTVNNKDPLTIQNDPKGLEAPPRKEGQRTVKVFIIHSYIQKIHLLDGKNNNGPCVGCI